MRWEGRSRTDQHHRRTVSVPDAEADPVLIEPGESEQDETDHGSTVTRAACQGCRGSVCLCERLVFGPHDGRGHAAVGRLTFVPSYINVMPLGRTTRLSTSLLFSPPASEEHDDDDDEGSKEDEASVVKAEHAVCPTRGSAQRASFGQTGHEASGRHHHLHHLGPTDPDDAHERLRGRTLFSIRKLARSTRVRPQRRARADDLRSASALPGLTASTRFCRDRAHSHRRDSLTPVRARRGTATPPAEHHQPAFATTPGPSRRSQHSSRHTTRPKHKHGLLSSPLLPPFPSTDAHKASRPPSKASKDSPSVGAPNNRPNRRSSVAFERVRPSEL